MKIFLKEFLCLTIVFLLLDIIWKGLIMNSKYLILIKEIQGQSLEFKPLATLLAYLFLIFGMYYFIIMRMKRYFDILNILSLSIPFGLTVYGVFEFTTACMLKKWDYFTAFNDILWGCFICSISSIIIGLYRKYIKEDNEILFSQNLFLS